MYATTIAALPMACPECETELDQSSGLCPACRWSAGAVRPAQRITPADDGRSFVERYRGTEYDRRVGFADDRDEAPNRTRLLLGGGLVGIVGLFYFIGQSLVLF